MSLNEPKSWANGRPPTDRELLDTKLGANAPKREEMVTISKGCA